MDSVAAMLLRVTTQLLTLGQQAAAGDEDAQAKVEELAEMLG